MVWEWIAWNLDDVSYDFDVSDDGSNGMHAQINYMNSKVSLGSLHGCHGPHDTPCDMTCAICHQPGLPHLPPRVSS